MQCILHRLQLETLLTFQRPPGPFSPTASIFSADQGASLYDPFMNTPQIGNTNFKKSSLSCVGGQQAGHNVLEHEKHSAPSKLLSGL